MTQDEELGRAFYLAMYETDGAKWSANEHQDLWIAKAQDYEKRRAEFIPAQQTLKPVAWRYQLADMRIWHNDAPGEYTDWQWKVTEHEPNAGAGMRNVTPLYAHPASVPPQGGSAQLQKSQAKEPEASGGLCATAPHAVQVGEPTRIGAVVGDQEAEEPSLTPDPAEAGAGSLRDLIRDLDAWVEALRTPSIRQDTIEQITLINATS